MSQDQPVVYRDTPLPSDLEAIRQLADGTGFFRPDEVLVAVELVEERLAKGEASGYYFRLAESAGRLVAYSCFGPTPCTIGSYDLYWIVVGKEWQGRGLGLEVERVTASAIARAGGKRVYAETSGKDLYLPTRRFYLKAGYFAAATLPDFYDVGDDKVIYQKNLNHEEQPL